MDEKGLGRRIQEARRAAKLTQQVLCQQANISYSTLAKIERGAIKSPSIFTIQSLVTAMGGSLDVLMGMNQPQMVADGTTGHSRNGIEFVYFDINGSLVHYSQRAFTALARDSGTSVEAIEAAMLRYDQAVCNGQMSLGQFEASLARLTGLPTVDWTAYYLAAVEPVPGMGEVMRWAAGHYQVGLLTNTMPGLVRALINTGAIPDISYAAVIDSSVVGHTKPELEIFQIAATQAAVEPQHILLVDDITQNTTAAARLGWQTLHCDDDEPEATVARIHQALELI